ncbi:MAG: proline--tRNA ligase [Rhodomicrobium sp.]|nr:MAG: proline--tRNA ligase [Rhodomicrobium sp.]
MRLSQYLMPTRRDVPAGAEIRSHQLMLRTGMIRQSAAGIYSWLPLGLKVLRKIEAIIREEQDRAGALELLMPTIQSADIWRESGRYDDYGKEMLRIKDRHDRELLYGPTNEEQITQIFRDSVKSYKDCPRILYHIQWKFRDEIRPRFGVMRGREFLMKDAYSFDLDEERARKSYQRMFISYLRTFERLGLRAIPMKADTGPIGGDLSHEFIILADTGESAVFCHKALTEIPAPSEDINFDDDLTPFINEWTSHYAATEEMHDEARFNSEVAAEDQISARGIEVGHIFYFGEKYSKAMKCTVQGPDGQMTTLHSGSYGIGVSRLVGAIIEASHDENGIVWPKSVAPFDVGIINLKPGDEAADEVSNRLYKELNAQGLDCLMDDTNERAGGKFATMDLIGLPIQLIVGPKGVKSGVVEIKDRKTGEREEQTIETAVAKIIASHKLT